MKLVYKFREIIPNGEVEPVRFIWDIYTASGRDYDKVTEIEISDGVQSICSDVFSKFKNLRTVRLPEGLKDFGGFTGLEQLESVSLPDSITEIEDEAFYGCRSLRSITIPKNVKYIGGCAFFESGIEEITLLSLEKLDTVKDNAFAGVRNVKYNLPESAEKRTVAYTPDMGTPNLVPGYRERARGKSLLEQAKSLLISHESLSSDIHDFYPHIACSTFYPCDFITDFARIESYIVDDGVIVGYNVFRWTGDKRVSTPLLIGVPTCISYEASYLLTGDNNGAGYKSDDDEVYYSPLYTLVYEIGHKYPTTDSFDQAENYPNDED